MLEKIKTVSEEDKPEAEAKARVLIDQSRDLSRKARSLAQKKR